MASSAEYLLYVLDLLRCTGGISHKKMMGEYLLYKEGILIGGLYDNRFLIRITPSNAGAGLSREIPYGGAKPMYLIDSEDPGEIETLVSNVFTDLVE